MSEEIQQPPKPEDGGTPRKCHIDQIKALEQKCASQAAELSKAQAALKDRSKQLTAMHWVWCSGPCGDMTLNKEIIEMAIRNTERMIEKFNGQSSNRAWKSLNEWPEKQDALVKAWGELNTTLRESAGLKEKLAEATQLIASYEALSDECGTEFEGVDEVRDVIRLLKQERNQLQSTVARLRGLPDKWNKEAEAYVKQAAIIEGSKPSDVTQEQSGCSYSAATFRTCAHELSEALSSHPAPLTVPDPILEMCNAIQLALYAFTPRNGGIPDAKIIQPKALKSLATSLGSQITRAETVPVEDVKPLLDQLRQCVEAFHFHGWDCVQLLAILSEMETKHPSLNEHHRRTGSQVQGMHSYS